MSTKSIKTTESTKNSSRTTREVGDQNQRSDGASVEVNKKVINNKEATTDLDATATSGTRVNISVTTVSATPAPKAIPPPIVNQENKSTISVAAILSQTLENHEGSSKCL